MSKPDFRTQFSSLRDLFEYSGQQREIHGGMYNMETMELAPQLDVRMEEPEIDQKSGKLIEGPRIKEFMNPEEPFSAVMFRSSSMAPLGLTTEEVGKKILTCGSSTCDVIHLFARTPDKKRGIYSVFHVDQNNKNVLEILRQQINGFHSKGYTRLEMAEVLGGVDLKRSHRFTNETLGQYRNVSQSLLREVQEMGFVRVIDHTWEKRPKYTYGDANMGGMITRRPDQTVDFRPIGLGVWDKRLSLPQTQAMCAALEKVMGSREQDFLDAAGA
jgi:hypothetical protein